MLPENIYLLQLKNMLKRKIYKKKIIPAVVRELPGNEKISLLFLSTSDKVLDGDCFVDTNDDSRGVEDEEHDDSHNKDE